MCHFLLHTWTTMTAAHILLEWVPPNRSGPQSFRLRAINMQPETSRGKQWCNDRRIHPVLLGYMRPVQNKLVIHAEGSDFIHYKKQVQYKQHVCKRNYFKTSSHLLKTERNKKRFWRNIKHNRKLAAYYCKVPTLPNQLWSGPLWFSFGVCSLQVSRRSLKQQGQHPEVFVASLHNHCRVAKYISMHWKRPLLRTVSAMGDWSVILLMWEVHVRVTSWLNKRSKVSHSHSKNRNIL